MPASTPPTPSSFNNEDQNLSNIFIGREQQIDLFTFYLNRWQQMMADSEPDETLVTAAPSPDNKLQGLLVLLYGRGGFGKSTLLRRFSNIAQASDRHLTAGKPIDWEFAIEGKRGLFNPPPGQEMDATDYYQALCGHLAISLNKQPQDFRQYQVTVKAVEKARKDAQGVVDNLQKDDRYGWVRGISIELVKLAVGTYFPGSGVFMELPIVKSATDGAAKLTQDQIKSLRDKLQDKLGSKFGDYLDAGLRLGLALGRDLHGFARNFPLLFFFDTYEEVDEGDHLLRVVMSSAGKRVGWVIAGRDNLWAGPGQIERSISIEYGYKELIPTDRGLSIDFNTGGIGAFTLSDIKDYFALIWQEYNLTLPHLSESDLKRILDVTSGVPLAVKIAAGLYLDTESLETVTEAVTGKRTIIDQMVRRYLLHARDSQEERAKLYGLAMLRRADQPTAVSAALNLTPEQAQTSYASELSRLHRRYSFIFTEKEEPALHQEVRSFLRQWLLEHRKDPEVIAINKRLKAAQEEVLKDLEERISYTSLQERLEDEEWISAYLDLTEQQYWFDPVEGVRTILPFMMAAAIYQRDINDDAANVGTFFETSVRAPYQDWWKWAEQSLIYLHSRTLSHEELKGLEQLEKLTQQRCPAFPPPIPDYRQELQAAIWWRLGEAYQDEDDTKSLAWYKQALTKLGHMDALKEATARVTLSVAIALYRDKRFDEMIPLLDRA
ncbi:MAG TPA: hypothetical protein VFN23_10485, partial [Ktedonobacteraceae bacterium]|nr:hypothetical protein [Ktedonobacteraceae bacterium]